jgi:hypothetical protein
MKNIGLIRRGTIPRRIRSGAVQYFGGSDPARYNTSADQIVPRGIKIKSLKINN